MYGITELVEDIEVRPRKGCLDHVTMSSDTQCWRACLGVRSTPSSSQLNWYSPQPQDTGRADTVLVTERTRKALWGTSKGIESRPGYMTLLFQSMHFHSIQDLSVILCKVTSLKSFHSVEGLRKRTTLITAATNPRSHFLLSQAFSWEMWFTQDVICSPSRRLTSFSWSTCRHAGEIWVEAGIMRCITNCGVRRNCRLSNPKGFGLSVAELCRPSQIVEHFHEYHGWKHISHYFHIYRWRETGRESERSLVERGWICKNTFY